MNKRYDNDDTVGMSYNDSPLKNVLISSAIAIGGVFAYKKGLLKKPIANLLKYAGSYKSYTSEMLGTINNWTREYENIPKNSIFRTKSFKDLFDKKVRENLKEDTIKDVSELRKRLRNEHQRLNGVTHKNYDKTDIMYDMNAINNTIADLQNVSPQQRQMAKKTMLDNFFRRNAIEQKTKEIQKKRSGYHTATIGDLYNTNHHMDLGKNGEIFLSKKGSNKHIDLSDNPLPVGDEKSTLERIEGFLNQDYYDENGRTIKVNGRNKKVHEHYTNFRDIKIDRDIMVDELGGAIDLRSITHNFDDFIASFSKDFQIPIIGLNPLRLFGLDKRNIRTFNFAAIKKESMQNFITNETGRDGLVEKSFRTNKSLMFVDGDVFKFTDDGLEKIESKARKKAILIPNDVHEHYNIPTNVNELRKIAGLGLREFEEGSEEHNMFKKLLNTLDLGKQDRKIDDLFEKENGAMGIFDPNTYIEALTKKGTNLFNRINPSIDYNLRNVFGDNNNGNLFYVINESYKLSDVFDKKSATTVGDYFKQFIAGRDDLEHVTEATAIPFYGIERVNQTLGTLGLGLSIDSTKSTFDTAKNLILKRFLPVYGAIQLYQYGVSLTEFGEDENGNPNNIQKVGANVVKRIDIGFHKGKDVLGLTDVFKELDKLTPGNDQIAEMPGVNLIDLKSTTEEREQYYETGMDPIRKARYWTLGEDSFTGGKVQYFKPNIYRSIMADAEFSDSQYGSRDEYFDNAWFPTPTHPFAPLKHFVFDKYHYENKHYNDRPYLLSSPEFENVPIFGPILSSTIGQLLKPQIRMHQEYWNNDGVNLDHNPSGNVVTDSQGYIVPQAGLNLIQQLNTTNKIINDGSKLIIPKNLSITNEGYNGEGDSGQMEVMGTNKESLSTYMTSSGNVNIVDLGNNYVGKVRQLVQEESIKKVEGVNDRVTLTKERIDGDTEIGANDYGISEADGSLESSLYRQYHDLANLGGIYGFGAEGFITGRLGTGGKQIETSGYAYSFNKAFWDQELGGLSGDLSEIFRRFVPQRRKDVEYINPVKNTMPTFLPNGDSYFLDFHSGDPYMKVQDGIERLPGEGYERLWGIKNPYEMNIGSSFIGKSEQDIIKHLLHQDSITDDNVMDAIDTGNKVHKKIEKLWLEKGVAIDVEGKIEDKANHILGFYDARIHDETTDKGEAIVDIKTVNAKKFEEIKESQTPVDYHQKQVNYYLNATKLDKGYIHYVNSENTDEQFTLGFNYDEDMYKDTMQTLDNARSFLKSKIESKEIGAGDLYPILDKYRILGDTAPYSKEFREMDKTISKMSLSDDEMEEVRSIRDRIRAVKEPLRVYDYKFRTAEVERIPVTVTKIIDANTFMTSEFDNPIRLAGVRVSEAKNNPLREEIDEYLSDNIYEGAKLSIDVAANEEDRVANDTLKTIHAVVYNNNVNLNYRMIQNGYGNEKKTDNSPTGIRARFTPGEIAFGSAWEKFAHFDTYLHTKFLQVRSAAEDYERREVYGKNFKVWENPIKDFLIPSVQTNINRPYGIAMGAIIGSLFGTTKYGKLVGAVTGALTVTVGKAMTGTKETATGKKWVPERRQKERNLNEYIDALKYVKFQKLYKQYEAKAKAEGFDVKKFLDSQKAKGDARKNRILALEEFKRQTKINGKVNKDLIDELFKTGDPKYISKGIGPFKWISRDVDYVLHGLNAEIKELKEYRDIKKLPQNAIKAIEYHNAAEQTMYGYDPGEPITNLLKALPKKERNYMRYFMKAPEQERDKILSIAPDYLKRPLQAMWNRKIDDKPSLDEYFSDHQLPDDKWEGWNENNSLDILKVKMVKHEGLDFAEFDMWKNDVDAANNYGQMELPKLNLKSKAHDIRRQLIDSLGSLGLENIKVNYNYTGSDINAKVLIKDNMRKEMEEQINNYEF